MISHLKQILDQSTALQYYGIGYETLFETSEIFVRISETYTDVNLVQKYVGLGPNLFVSTNINYKLIKHCILVNDLSDDKFQIQFSDIKTILAISVRTVVNEIPFFVLPF